VVVVLAADRADPEVSAADGGQLGTRLARTLVPQLPAADVAASRVKGVAVAAADLLEARLPRPPTAGATGVQIAKGRARSRPSPRG
jgi:hypothetical protein